MPTQRKDSGINRNQQKLCFVSIPYLKKKTGKKSHTAAPERL